MRLVGSEVSRGKRDSCVVMRGRSLGHDDRLVLQVKSHIQTLGEARKSVILVGIETHVCVQQTALDLLELGYDVHIIVDGVSSQKPLDRAVALKVWQ